MATFYHGKPEIRPADGLQTLYLMKPTYVGYSADASATSPANSNMPFLNSTAMGNSIGQANLSLAQQQHFVGIPLHQQPESVGDHGLDHRAQYQLWNFADHQRTTSTISTPSNQGGLSLSFSTEQHKNYAIQPPNSQLPTAVSSNRGEDQVKFSGSSSSLTSGVLIGSMYLKVAQELLDEVVSVTDKGVKDEPSKTTKPAKAKDEDGSNSGGGKSLKRAGAELATVERQEIQMKKAKLVHMLDEVEQRYRHYHHQMQTVMSSFDTIAGLGSARTYTALALKTISRQFRCLRDAISGQIRSASNSLGEEDCLTRSRSEGGSRLRFVDYKLRQQRALQQLGMMYQNAWRPQRGLPERSVSILRAWLFENFLHPYPKDCDKHVLAKQTGLTRNQVSNWFINARVRLWKPMVEEMYLEEMKEKEHHNNNNNGENKSNNIEEEFELKSTSGTEQLSIPTPSSRIQTGYDEEEEEAAEEEEIIPSNIKKSRTIDRNHHHQIPQLEMDMKPMDRPNSRDHHNHHHHLLDRCFNNSGGSGGYSINEMSRFFSTDQFRQPQYSTTDGGVSLTLGLQHCEGLQFSGAQPTYLFTDPDAYSSGGNNIKPLMSPPPNAYESLSLQNRKRFAAAQLLQDFVA